MSRKRPLLALATATALSLAAPGARAQFAAGTGPATWEWQQLQFGKQIKEYATQIEQYAKQIEQLQAEVQTQLNTLHAFTNMVQQAASLPADVIGTVNGDLAQVVGSINQLVALQNEGSLLQGQVAGMLANLQSIGQGGAYPIANVPGGFVSLVNTQGQSIGNAVNAFAQSLQKLQAQLSTEGQNFSTLGTTASTSTSRNAILQGQASIQAATGQAVVQGQQTTANGLQVLATTATAKANQDAYVATLSQAQDTAGIEADCTAASGTGIVITMAACNQQGQ